MGHQIGRPRAPIGVMDEEQILTQVLVKRRRELFVAAQHDQRTYFARPGNANPYSQSSVARKLGISPTALCQWEMLHTKGYRTIFMWKKWAAALGMKFTVTLE